jgi:GNAT superfamily N-acetyltransferase
MYHRPVETVLASYRGSDGTTQVTIRRSQPDDATRLSVLLQNHYNWINVYNSPFSVVHRMTSEDSMRQALTDFPSVVAEVDDLPIGFAVTRPQEPSIIQLHHIYVDDPYRNNGIATAMIPVLEQQVQLDGFSIMMATSSTRWYPDKPLPTKVFVACGYDVTRLDEHTELYLHKLANSEDIDARPAPLVRHIAWGDHIAVKF